MSGSSPSGSSSINDLFRAGHLTDAIAAATAEVRKATGAAGPRMLLAELLLFTGDLERSERMLDAAASLDPTYAVTIAEFRQLLRAEQARRQMLSDGRLPEFLPEGPTPSQQDALAALVALREGNLAEATQHIAAAEAGRAATAFQIDGEPVADLRDTDDLLGGTLEILTPTGKYLWLPIERITFMTLHKPESPRDLFWRRVSLKVQDGPDGDVYIPVTYIPDPSEADEAIRLGRISDWRDLADGFARGRGQRMFLAGDDGRALLDIGQIERTA